MAAGGVISTLGEELGGLRAATGLARHIPPKLYHISEIVEYSGVSRQTIHNYTTMGLITESRRTTGGHRLYEEGVFARLDAVESLKRQKKSLREIRAQLATLKQNAQ
jgi:DNA-binding transcriptional MerR regulator